MSPAWLRTPELLQNRSECFARSSVVRRFDLPVAGLQEAASRQRGLLVFLTPAALLIAGSCAVMMEMKDYGRCHNEARAARVVQAHCMTAEQIEWALADIIAETDPTLKHMLCLTGVVSFLC
jgi:hypothetical protein